MGKIYARFRRFWHCLWWSMALRHRHRAIDIYPYGKPVTLLCECGKRWYGDEKPEDWVQCFPPKGGG